MCLAIPGKILEIKETDGNITGIVDFSGVKTEVSLSLIENPEINDYVIVHAGFALNKINETEALETIRLIKELND